MLFIILRTRNPIEFHPCSIKPIFKFFVRKRLPRSYIFNYSIAKCILKLFIVRKELDMRSPVFSATKHIYFSIIRQINIGKI